MSTSSAMPEATYRDAIKEALRTAMHHDESVLLMGEDIGAAGGVFKVTEGLQDEFGMVRVNDTPISENAFVGAAIGLALAGYRPVVEMMFAEFASVAYEQIVLEAANYLYLTAGQMNVPIVVRIVGGAGGRFGAQHSQTTESWYLSSPGLKVVTLGTVQSAYGLLLAAISDPGPVIVIEHKFLYTTKGDLDTAARPMSLGKAQLLRAGSGVTLVASLAMIPRALQAADLLATEGTEVEVIDLVSLAPIDVETLQASVAKTRRLVTVEEQPLAGGWGSQVVAELACTRTELFEAAPVRIGLPHAPVPFSPKLEDAALPSPEQIAEACRSTLS
jgi:pyruvate/2-oxoglutarate/acetoin dehydrogenase E1 component